MSDSVIIEPIAKDDDEGFFRLVESERERLARYFPTIVGSCTDVRATRRYIKDRLDMMKDRTFFCYVMRDYEGSEPVGAVILKQFDQNVPKCEVGYLMGSSHQGQGLATLGLMWAVDRAFTQLGITKVCARIAPDNLASIRVAEKCGFQREGLLRQEFRAGNGKLIDVLYYGMLK